MSPNGIIEQYVKVILTKSDVHNRSNTHQERMKNISFPIVFPVAFLGASVTNLDTPWIYIETSWVSDVSKTSITVWAGIYLPVNRNDVLSESDVTIYLRVWGK
ncbi:hypothetical protein BB987_18855 [Photorhabdus temperata]|uniref:Putative tail fiber protein gp53-like C-terminal domain-containing protein n=1 Tax=Photorhabdus khanii NC19 TaxID=1004151 RepID=W3V7F9_9GAMM|nr:hypothetical protein [Photorhabdus khanii]ETS31782.1 hypothetical protein PTE_01879 [Photorhabdus khanii NC19]OHV50338.1 hypothetical protein BB987_18855 [Photorhabdus temperata]